MYSQCEAEPVGDLCFSFLLLNTINLRNPALNSKGNTLCNHIAKKVSSWFVIPADLDLLTELVKDYSLQTQATTPATIIKALLTTLLSRGFDLDPEHLLVSKSDIMAMMK